MPGILDDRRGLRKCARSVMRGATLCIRKRCARHRLRAVRTENASIGPQRPSTPSISFTVKRGVMCFGQFQSHASTVMSTARSTGAL